MNQISDIRQHLFSLRDPEYAAFSSKLAPTLSPDLFIGVRVPLLRAYAKELIKQGMGSDFLAALPHQYYEENLLHGLVLEKERDFEACIALLDAFLPYVDNWAVCDTMAPAVFKKRRDLLLPHIRRWTKSDHVYTCRFGVSMLMRHFLDEDFRPEYLDIPASIISDEYYVNMMNAWYFATALAKQWDSTIVYLEEKRLTPWVHRKTIQKACESFRITPEQKAYLKSLK